MNTSFFAYCFSILLVNSNSPLQEIPDSVYHDDPIIGTIIQYTQKELLASSTTDTLQVMDILYALGAAKILINSTALEDQIVGDIICQNAATILQYQLDKGLVNRDSPGFLQVERHLASMAYLLDLGNSDWEKLVFYATQGRWRYIGRRIISRGYLNMLLVGGLVLCITIILIFKYKKYGKLL